MIIDISPIISPSIAVFPGDKPFSSKEAHKFRKWRSFNALIYKSTVHLGAHTDAPCHYKGGESIESAKLNNYIGTAQVIEVTIERGQRISVKDIGNQEILAPRILFKTNSFPDPNNWNNDFNALSPELVDFLRQ